MKFISLTFATILSVSLYTTQVTAAAVGAANDVDAVTHITVEVHHKKDGSMEFKPSAKHFGDGSKKADADAVLFSLKDTFNKVVDKSKELVGKAGEVAKSAAGAVFDAGKQVASSALQGTVNFVTDPANIIKIAKGGIEAGTAYATGGTKGLTDHVAGKITGAGKKPVASNDNDE
ncbi:MAG: hypothetical protein Q8S31_07280 [Alphaproteobacteria bacterium]|nr:hypothetical protein [Alphaproteobacteria bacterium]